MRFSLLTVVALLLAGGTTHAVAINTVMPVSACCTDDIDDWEHPQGFDVKDKVPAYDDIWERIRVQLTLRRDLHRSPVRNALNELVRHLPSLFETMEEATPYLHYVIEQVEARNLPIELALIPFVESKFNPRATSVYNASGLWQFIPATADHFKITDNWWFDGRRDVIVSTNAALDYLELLVRHFDGDWMLAIAAYNGGPARVRRQVAASQARGLRADYWSLDLPRETRRYVPELLALAEIIRWGQVNGRPLPHIADAPHFRAVTLGAQVDLLQVATLADISIDEFFRLNAGMLRWATPPSGPHRVLLPVDADTRFNKQYSRLTDTAKTVDWHAYLVRPGDSLDAVSSLFETPASIVRQLNALGAHDQIQAGSYLLVPLDDRPIFGTRGGTFEHQATTQVSLVDLATRYGVAVQDLRASNPHLGDSNVLVAQESLLVTSGPVVPKESVAPKVARYRIRAGDTLSGIASRLGTTVDALVAMNNLPSNLLYPGNTISIPIARQP